MYVVMFVHKSFCKTFYAFMTTTHQSLKRFIKTALNYSQPFNRRSVNPAWMKKIVK